MNARDTRLIIIATAADKMAIITRTDILISPVNALYGKFTPNILKKYVIRIIDVGSISINPDLKLIVLIT
jgi:hypothetical protein